MGLRTGVLAGEEWFSIYVVRPVIKDVSHESAMSVIPISCRRFISIQWLIVSKAADRYSNSSTEPCLLSRFDNGSLEIGSKQMGFEIGWLLIIRSLMGREFQCCMEIHLNDFPPKKRPFFQEKL